MIRTILYPTDLGLYSSYLLQHVATLAESYDARIVAVHAVEPLGVFADAVLETYVPQDMMSELKQTGLQSVMEAIRLQVVDAFEEEFIDYQMDSSRISDVRVVRGNACDVILEEAKRCRADLIVMGSHSQRENYSPTLGSVVSKVLQISSVPVFMVPIAEPQFRQQELHQSKHA